MTVEELQAEVLELKEQLKEKENLENQIKEKDERIKSLEEHNQRLFLKATSTTQKEQPIEEKFECEALGEYVDLLSDDEIETLRDIMEEI